MPFPRLVRLAATLLVSLLCHVSPGEEATSHTDTLSAWRTHFPALLGWMDAAGLDFPSLESAQEPAHDAPRLTDEQFGQARALVNTFRLRDGHRFAYPAINGPETPFPDHHPVRQLASLRTFLVREALQRGDSLAAFDLALDNLALARATLLAQEGIVPLIHAGGVWQAALDSAHALIRSDLPPHLSRSLLDTLLRDADLAARAARRALSGEYAFVFKPVVERMPETDDPDLFLAAVSTLGMSPPEPLPPGELGLGLTDHRIIDVPATLAAYQEDLAPYLAALESGPRLPLGLFERHTAPRLAAYSADLGLFLTYATGELPLTLPNIALARAAFEGTANPGGKLLAVFLTPPWHALLANLARREAQRSALCALLAWRIQGGPTPWEVLVAKRLLPAPPADPFSPAALRYELAPAPRVWSVFADGLDSGGLLEDANYGQPEDLVWLP